jgi:hypothetical protein
MDAQASEWLQVTRDDRAIGARIAANHRVPCAKNTQNQRFSDGLRGRRAYAVAPTRRAMVATYCGAVAQVRRKPGLSGRRQIVVDESPPDGYESLQLVCKVFTRRAGGE